MPGAQAEKQKLPRMSSAYAFIADPAGSAVAGYMPATPFDPYPDQTAPGLSIAALTSTPPGRPSTMVQLNESCKLQAVCMHLAGWLWQSCHHKQEHERSFLLISCTAMTQPVCKRGITVYPHHDLREQ